MNYPEITFDNWTLSASCDVIARQYDNNSRALYVVGELPEGYEWDMLVSVEDNLNIIRLSPMDEGIGAVLTDDQLAFGNVAYTMQLRGDTRGCCPAHEQDLSIHTGQPFGGCTVADDPIRVLRL